MYISLRGNAGNEASTEIGADAPVDAAVAPAVAPAVDAAGDPAAAGSAGARSARARRGVPAAVIAFGVVSLLTDVSSESVAAVLPLYVTAVLGLGPLAYGFVDGIYQGVSAMVRLLGGWWADESRRPKWVAFVGYGVSALSKLGLLLPGGLGLLTASVTVDRLGKGLRTGPRDALIATASTPDRLGRNFGVHRALDTTGALIGPLLAFAVLAAIPLGLGGYHAVFVISTAFAVLGLATLALVVPDLRTRTAAPSDRGTRNKIALRLADLRRPALRRLLLAAGVLGLVTIGDGFLYLALADSGDLVTHYFPLLFVGTNLAYLALAVPCGRLADLWGRGRVFLTGHLLLLAAYLLVASGLGAGAGAAGAALVLLLLGAFYAATDGVLAALAARLVPAASRASGIAAAQTVVALSRFVSSIGFGLLWQLTARSTAVWVMAGGLVVGLVLAVRLLAPLSSTPGPGGATPAEPAGGAG